MRKETKVNKTLADSDFADIAENMFMELEFNSPILLSYNLDSIQRPSGQWLIDTAPRCFFAASGPLIWIAMRVVSTARIF